MRSSAQVSVADDEESGVAPFFNYTGGVKGVLEGFWGEPTQFASIFASIMESFYDPNF